LADLVQHLIVMTETNDVLIPFHLYVHPTTRYLLWDAFPEQTGQPQPSNRPVEMLLIPNKQQKFDLLYVNNIPESASLVLLTRDATGQGAAYVSRPPHIDEQTRMFHLLVSAGIQPRPHHDKLGREIGQFISLPEQSGWSVTDFFSNYPERTITLNWAGMIQLEGYGIKPEVVEPGQKVSLNLYWRSLTDKTFDYPLCLQLLAGNGHPVDQRETRAINEDMYRWRSDGILATQHTFELASDLTPGPYLIRISFFDEISGKRLPVQTTSWPPLTDEPLDQIQLGLFYVSPEDTNPRQPATLLSANFASAIDLIGVTLPESSAKLHNPQLPVTLHWQVRRPTAKPQTVFLQLLNEQGQIISDWNSQPFDGLYPTNLWSPGEIITDTFLLPLPAEGLSAGAYRLITGFYNFETGQRMPTDDGQDFTEVGKFVIDNSQE
jgi:hypothetical protein